MPVTKDHPATADFPDQWRYVRPLRVRGADGKQEEVYNFRSDPRANGATVILTVDTSSFTGKSSHFTSTTLFHNFARLTSAKSEAEDIDNGTTTGNYPSQGDPHPIGTYPISC